jgi:hypothetical protein
MEREREKRREEKKSKEEKKREEKRRHSPLPLKMRPNMSSETGIRRTSPVNSTCKIHV